MRPIPKTPNEWLEVMTFIERSIVFENGEKSVLDMKPLLYLGVFHRLKKYEIFRQVRIGFDTIEWECGVDLDPEFIYAKCMAQAIA